MAMTPEEKNTMNQLQKTVDSLLSVRDTAFIAELKRRLEIPARLSDLQDVSDTDDATTGQVLKKTDTTWQPGTDNTA